MADWITGTCKTNGIDMHYLRTGGNKPPVVMLHGLILSGACWTPLAQTLEKNYDVVMPDARGHGHSTATSHGYNYENFAADVIGLIEALELDRPVLLGHSMGGMTAALVAKLQSLQLRGLILADPTFLPLQRQHEVYASDIVYQHQQIIKRPIEDYLTEIQVRHSHRSPQIIELFAQARFQTSIDAFKILAPPNPDYLQLISTLNIPSLLVIGDTNSVVSTKMATELTKLNPHLEVVQISAAGHAVPYDQPERFSAVVQTFLRSVIT